jgi:hypothetical protein
MPEGDTIFRAARTLHRALAGKPVTGFESVLPALNRIHEDAPITGRTIERIGVLSVNHARQQICDTRSAGLQPRVSAKVGAKHFSPATPLC